MTKSFKMLTLQAMLNADCMPGEISIEQLTAGFAQIARRSSTLRSEVEADIDNLTALGQYLERNPVDAWSGRRGTRQGTYYFKYEQKVLGTTFGVAPKDRGLFQELVEEIVEWRLAEYLGRPSRNTAEGGAFVCKVSHANQRPILFLPDRSANPNLPSGWTDVLANGELYQANFVKVAVNVVRRKGSSTNQLPVLMRGWFGPDAGLPGSNFQVVFRKSGLGYALEPMDFTKSDGMKR